MPGWLTSETVELLVNGALVTVLLTAITTVGAMAVATGVAATRFSGGPLARRLATAYVELFRNVPALIQIIFWAFAFPSVFPADIRRTIFFDNMVADAVSSVSRLPLPYYAFAACFGLVLNTSGHLAEILRAGIGSVPSEQFDLARTMGASKRVVFRSVALPEGLRAAWPAVSNRLVHNMKNTALASFVAVPELFHQMEASINRTFRATEYLMLTAGMYLLLSLALSALLGSIDHRLHRGRSRTISG